MRWRACLCVSVGLRAIRAVAFELIFKVRRARAEHEATTALTKAGALCRTGLGRAPELVMKTRREQRLQQNAKLRKAGMRVHEGDCILKRLKRP